MVKIIKSTFLSPNGTISSKRITGFLMISLAGFLISIACVNNTEYNPNLTGLIRDMIYCGSGLLGITTLEKRFKQIENE